MAFGSSIASAISPFFSSPGTQGMIGAAGGLYDIYDAFTNRNAVQEERERAMAMQQAISKFQMEMAGRSYADDIAMRDRLLGQTGALGNAIRQAYGVLGPTPTANPADIYARYQTLREIGLGDFNRIVDRVSTQGFADSIVRGLDKSTFQNDRAIDLMRTLSPEVQKINQAAWADAIGQAGQMQTVVQQGRNNTINEVTGMFMPQLTAELGMYRPGAAIPALNGAAYGSANMLNMLGGAERGANTALQQQLQNFKTQYAPNMASYLGYDTRVPTMPTTRTYYPSNDPTAYGAYIA